MFTMPPSSRSSRAFHRALISLGTLATMAFAPLVACDSSSTTPLSTMGVIEVTTLTEGQELLPDSFEVLINGSRSGTTGSNDVYYMETLPRGSYQVGLREDQEDCRFIANPREVLVTPNDTAYATFLVICQ